MIVKIDDVATGIERENFYQLLPASKFIWFENDKIPTILNEIIVKVQAIIDMTEVTGYTAWINYNTSPYGKHSDYDEVLFEETGEKVYPVCSIVYYVGIDNLVGGDLVLQDSTKYLALENRVISWTSQVEHEVEEFTGTRIALMILAWKDKPKEAESFAE